MELKKCPDCTGEMEKGICIDFAHGGGIVPEKFALGATPEKSSFQRIGKVGNLTKVYNVISYRCNKCHRLFQYTEEGSIEMKDVRARAMWIAIIIISLCLIIPFLFIFVFRP